MNLEVCTPLKSDTFNCCFSSLLVPIKKKFEAWTIYKANIVFRAIQMTDDLEIPTLFTATNLIIKKITTTKNSNKS